MARKSNVVKFKRPRGINIGIVIFLVFFMYVIFNILLYWNKEHISIYEINEGTDLRDTKVMAIILRDEEVYYSQDAGYLSYLIKPGDRAYKNAPVYSLDDNKQIFDMIVNGEAPLSPNKEDISQIKANVKRFVSKYTDVDYNMVYEFKDHMENTASLLLNETMLLNIDKIKEETGYTSNYHTVYSNKSGLVTYYMDSFENVIPEQVDMEMFNLEGYNRINLRTMEMLAVNSPIYKLISKDQWTIIFPINDEQYARLQDKETIGFSLIDNNIKLNEKFSIIQKDSNIFLKIDLDKYLPLYIDDRYVEIELEFDSVKGLKIPLSTLTEKSCYKVPLEFLTSGGNSTEQGVIKEAFDANTGEPIYEFVMVNIYDDDGTYAYIDSNLFPPDTYIRSDKDNSKYKMNETSILTGVFNVNNGYAIFKVIDVLYEGNEYCIINKNTKYGPSLYDHIALNARLVEENKIIY